MERNSEMICSKQLFFRVSSLRDQKQTKDYISDPETAMQMGNKLSGRLDSSLTSCYCTHQRRSLPLQYCSIVLSILLSLLRPSWLSFLRSK